MRGCDLDQVPADPCTGDRDCEAPERCHRGYCHGPAYIAEDLECRAAPACAEQGRCRSITVSSFLGTNRARECGAAEAEDCAASKVCRESGRCGVGDGWCIADSAEACARSRRCETHDECVFDGSYACVRRLTACPPLEGPAGPAWAQEFIDGVPLEMARMGGTWQPGAVDRATVACEVELPTTWPSRVQLGERCGPGPSMYGKRSSFVRTGVRLRPGDVISVASQLDPELSRPNNDSFIKAKYVGTSPIEVGGPGESLVCHVVAPEVARSLGLAALNAADEAIAAAARVRPEQFGLMSPPLTDARRATAEGGLWLGWDDPEVVARVQRMEEVEREFAAALGVMIAALRATATPPRTITTTNGELTLEVMGHVCGDALNARREVEARRPVEPTDCGLELRVEHRDSSMTSFTAGKDWLGPFRDLRWLRASGGLGEASEAVLVDIKPGAGARTTRAELQPGEQAVLLLVGLHDDLPLGRLASGETILLSGSIGSFDEPFVLRTELEREPAAAKPAKRAKRKRP